MTPLLLSLLTAVPCIYWTGGAETRPAIEAAAITRLCVPPEQVPAWASGPLTPSPLSEADLKARELLPSPGVAARSGLASPTRMPWVVAGGWRMMRQPSGHFAYVVPAGKAALAIAEAFTYGADAVVRIDPADLQAAGAMAAFLETIPAAELTPVADVAVVDDGSPVTGEVLNLLARRNLLFRIVSAPVPDAPITIRLGTPEYPAAEAADPSAFALKIRGQVTDQRRALRIFGSEVVVGRLTAAGGRARLQLLNYGGREIEGLRVRVRGRYRSAKAYVAGSGPLAIEDQATGDDATEFTLPRLVTYVAIDLE